MKKLIGYILISWPIIAIISLGIIEEGILVMSCILFFIVILIISAFTGVYLILEE